MFFSVTSLSDSSPLMETTISVCRKLIPGIHWCHSTTGIVGVVASGNTLFLYCVSVSFEYKDTTGWLEETFWDQGVVSLCFSLEGKKLSWYLLKFDGIIRCPAHDRMGWSAEKINFMCSVTHFILNESKHADLQLQHLCLFNYNKNQIFLLWKAKGKIVRCDD